MRMTTDKLSLPRVRRGVDAVTPADFIAKLLKAGLYYSQAETTEPTQFLNQRRDYQASGTQRNASRKDHVILVNAAQSTWAPSQGTILSIMVYV